MGYEIDSVEKIEIRDKDTGEKIGEIQPPITCHTEEDPAADEISARLTIPKENAQFTATIDIPPRPNIMMIISPGDHYGRCKTVICFYRKKHYNWFQRLMYKICFGITIRQGDEVRREFL